MNEREEQRGTKTAKTWVGIVLFSVFFSLSLFAIRTLVVSDSFSCSFSSVFVAHSLLLRYLGQGHSKTISKGIFDCVSSQLFQLNIFLFLSAFAFFISSILYISFRTLWLFHSLTIFIVCLFCYFFFYSFSYCGIIEMLENDARFQSISIYVLLSFDFSTLSLSPPFGCHILPQQELCSAMSRMPAEGTRNECFVRMLRCAVGFPLWPSYRCRVVESIDFIERKTCTHHHSVNHSNRDKLDEQEGKLIFSFRYSLLLIKIQDIRKHRKEKENKEDKN